MNCRHHKKEVKFKEQVTSLSSLLYIYNMVECAPDNSLVAGSVKIQHIYVSKVATFHISIINSSLSQSKNPALVSRGDALRTEIREIQEKLESIKIP